MISNLFSRRPELAGILSLGGGTLFGQLILVAATPFLSRIYSPASFGAFSTLIAIATVLGSSAALKFDAGVVIPADERTAGALAKLAIISTLVITILSGFALWALDLLGFGESWQAVVLAPLWVAIFVFLTALFTLLSQLALRYRMYSLVAKRSPIQSAATAAGQLGLGLFTQTPLGLLGGLAIGRASGLTPMARAVRPIFKNLSDPLKTTAKIYWRLPCILAPSAFMNALGSQIPLFAMASIFGASVAGEFSMSLQIVFIPMTLIGAAAAQVFIAELAKHVREGGEGATHRYLLTSLRLAFLAIPVALVIGLIGPLIIPLILGPDWNLVAAFCVPLSVSVGLALIVNPTSQVYTVFQTKASLFVDISRVALMGLAVWASLTWHSTPISTVWLLVTAQALNYVFTWVYGLRVTKIGLT